MSDCVDVKPVLNLVRMLPNFLAVAQQDHRSGIKVFACTACISSYLKL